MKKALPWLIGVGALFVLMAMISAGWLYSLLTIAINAGALFGLNWMIYKAPNQATRANGRSAALAVMVVSGCLMFVGGIMGIIGFANPGGETHLRRTECGWCGGSGRVSSGERCGLCSGAGGAASVGTAPDDFFFPLGTLMAASGVVLFFGAKRMREDNAQSPTSKTTPSAIAKPSATTAPNYSIYSHTANNVEHLETPSAKWFITHGHWKDGEWVRFHADAQGVWVVRCFVVYGYNNNKAITQSVFHLAPYDSNHVQLAPPSALTCSAYTITPKNNHTFWWDNMWQGKAIQYLRVTSIDLTYSDGSTETYHF